MALPVIPEYITVHLGPPDSPAENVRVPFADYIKNVASSEIYPTWPETAIRANILAQISFALNRVYTEFYRARGYDFDITNSTAYDQSFVRGRDIFENISRIVDNTFNDYIARQGNVEPLFAAYCDGREVQCNGLSQWGTVTLAERGLLPYEILQYYYGDDIDIIFNAPVEAVTGSYPGVPLRLGDVFEEVRIVQYELNRISDNYPSISKIPEVNGVFGSQTEAAVRDFQSVFNLAVDGIVGKATWYQIKAIYNAVKRLSDISSEGVTPEEAEAAFASSLSEGDSGVYVRTLQIYLATIAFFNDSYQSVAVDGVFGPSTRAAVEQVQRIAGLPVTGVVDRPTWAALQGLYENAVANIPASFGIDAIEIYPGRALSLGSEGREVEDLQKLINRAAANGAGIPSVTEDGIFGNATYNAVVRAQQLGGLIPNGIVGAPTWSFIAQLGR